jgi:hypothetical protein
MSAAAENGHLEVIDLLLDSNVSGKAGMLRALQHGQWAAIGKLL